MYLITLESYAKLELNIQRNYKLLRRRKKIYLIHESAMYVLIIRATHVVLYMLVFFSRTPSTRMIIRCDL